LAIAVARQMNNNGNDYLITPDSTPCHAPGNERPMAAGGNAQKTILPDTKPPQHAEQENWGYFDCYRQAVGCRR
jgi:hypothetical protein